MAESPKLHFRQVYEAELQRPTQLASRSSSLSSLDMIPYYLPPEENKSPFPVVFTVLCTFFLGVSAVVLGVIELREDRSMLATALLALGLGIVVAGCCCLCSLCHTEKQEEELELAQHPGARQSTF